MAKYYLLSFFLYAVALYPQDKDRVLKAEIDSLLNNNFFQSAQIAFEAYDLSSDKLLYKKNEKLLLKPASNLKILTTAAALNYLGKDYEFNTSIFYTGGIINGTLYGNLYVKGGCDPDFTLNNIDSLAAMVRLAGINKITGHIFGDISMMDSLFWGKGWMWDDDPSPDAPYLTPLNINKNSIGIIIKPSFIGEPPEVLMVPDNGFFKIENFAVTVPSDSPQTISIDRDWINRLNTIIIKGNIKNTFVPDSLTDTTWVNVYKPEVFFMNLFEEALQKNNIKFERNVSFTVTPIYAIKIYSLSRSLKEIIPGLNKNSYNLGAEMLLYAMGKKYFGEPATAKNGIKIIDSLIYASGFNDSPFRIVDGSGVSHYNLVSSELLISVLKFIYCNKPEIFYDLYSSLPVAGIDGTLKHRMIGTPAAGNVHAKTGTLSGVSTLCGYLTSKEGNLIAFSILIQNFINSPDEVKNVQDKICNLLIDY